MLVIAELGWLLNPFFVILIGLFSDRPTPPTPFPFYSLRDVLLYSILAQVFARVTLLFLLLSLVLLCLLLLLGSNNFSHSLYSVPG
jgi:hypothetical protein